MISNAMKIEQSLPESVKNLLKSDSFCVAGGYIRDILTNKNPNDIDIFYYGDKNYSQNDFIVILYKAFPNMKTYVSDNAITILKQEGNKYVVQLITKWKFNSPQEVIDHFDFTVVRAAFHYDNDKPSLVIGDHFYLDLTERKIRYTNPSDPEAGSSLIRMMKLIRNGYDPVHLSLVELITNLHIQIDKEYGLALAIGRPTDKATTIEDVVQLVLQSAYTAGITVNDA